MTGKSGRGLGANSQLVVTVNAGTSELEAAMIDHVTIPVRDLERSRIFYERAFAPMGFKVSFGEKGKFWAFDLGGNGLFEIYEESDHFTPIHVAFRVPNRDLVHQFYTCAREAGASDNGAPGPRPHYTPNYYACFVFDPDKHNIEAMHDKLESAKYKS